MKNDESLLPVVYVLLAFILGGYLFQYLSDAEKTVIIQCEATKQQGGKE